MQRHSAMVVYQASRINEFHASTTGSDARLYRKGKTAGELRYMAQSRIENRNAFVASAITMRVALPNAPSPGRWGWCE